MNPQGPPKDQILRQLIDCQRRVNELETLENLQKESLFEARAMFENLFELAPDALVVVNRQAQIVRVNGQAERLFGYTRDELIGMDHDTLVPEPRRAKHGAQLKEYMEKPRLRTMGIGLELYGRRKDGSQFPADIDLGPLEIGADFLVLAVVRDVTPRKKLEEDLLDSEQRYRELVELSPDAIIIAVEGKVAFVNASGARLFGATSPDHLVGRAVMDLVHPDYRQLVAERIRQTVEEERVVPLIEEKLLRLDGTEVFVDIVSMPFTYRDAPATLAIARDTTGKKRAEIARREAEERYQRTLDNMLEGCQIIDFNWRYLYLNEAAAIHGRRPRKELLGKTMMEMFPGIENTEVFKRLRECMETGMPRRMDNEFTFPDGSTGWFELCIQPVPEGIFVLSLDITQRKKLERELDSYRQRLEQVVAERTSEFARTNARLAQEVVEHMKAEEGLQLRAAILDNIGEAIFLINFKGEFVYVNEAACKAYGFAREEFLAMNVRQLAAHEEVSAMESRLEKVIQTRQLEVQVVHRRKDGTPMPVQASLGLIRTLHGEFIVGVVRPITW